MGKKSERYAIALRPQVHPPDSIVELAKMLEGESSNISNIFIPDIPGGFESIDIACASLLATKRLKIGSGVIRVLEHDEHLLQRRLETVQSMSRNRFVLGDRDGLAWNKPF